LIKAAVRVVPEDEGFLSDKTAVHGAAIKKPSSVMFSFLNFAVLFGG